MGSVKKMAPKGGMEEVQKMKEREERGRKKRGREGEERKSLHECGCQVPDCECMTMCASLCVVATATAREPNQTEQRGKIIN